MSQDLAAVGRRLYEEVFNQGRVELVEELVAEDFVEHESVPGMPTDRTSVPAFVQMFRGAFPDGRMDLEDVLVDGDKIACRVRMSGTHDGEFMGIAPTHRKFSVQTIDIIEFRDGKAIAHWGVTDTAAMLEQLGVAGTPA
jgi:steroid delta-isomerase-like uncharacterized protein